MKIVNTPTVTVDGINMAPYSVDYRYGGAEPSEVSVKFINKNGKYTPPEVTTGGSPVKINIGRFKSINAYPVETEVSRLAQGGSTMTVTYVDTSIILDKTLVGLRGVNGPSAVDNHRLHEAYGDFSNIVLVGTPLDPCEGMGDKFQPVDPCAPICFEGDTRESFDCEKERLLKILQVDYTFPELISALSAALQYKVVFGSIPASVQNDYRASYTGTAREVLKSWCNDFSISFYWENNAIYFYDLSVGITIQDQGIDNGQNIISYSESKSIRDNSTKVSTVYFGADGETRDYDCSTDSSLLLNLKPITFYDLISDKVSPRMDSFQGLDVEFPLLEPKNGTWVLRYDRKQTKSDKGLDNFFDCTVLSHYSEILRDLFALYVIYEIETADDMRDFINEPMAVLGDLKVRSVYASDSPDTHDQEKYKRLLARLPDPAKFQEKKGYFVVATYREEAHDQFLKMEKDLSERFMGKYWIRRFSKGNEYKFDAPDGNVAFYSKGSVVQFPFLNILPDSLKGASDFLAEISLGSIGEGETVTATKKFLMMERAAVWHPLPNSEAVGDFIKDVSPYQMVNMGPEDVKFVTNPTEDDGEDKETEYIFQLFEKPSNLDLDMRKNMKNGSINPIDAKNTGETVVFGKDEIVRNYGLTTSRTNSYTLKGPSKTKLTIFLPSQAGDKWGSEYNGYTVVANGQTSSLNHQAIITKKEVVLGTSSKNTNKDTSAQLVFKDATQNLIAFIDSSGSAKCGYNSAKILNLLTKFSARQHLPASRERETRTYEVSGIPDVSLNASHGLQSFSIVVGDDGAHTSITFSNLPPTNPAEELEERNFEKIAAILGKAKNYFKN